MLVYVCVCLFSIEIQTTGQIGMKFGTEVVLVGEGSWSGYDPIVPTHRYGVPLEPQPCVLVKTL